MTGEKCTARCPYPGCDAQIPVDRAMPNGVYLCICHIAQVRLCWDDFQADSCTLRLSLEKMP